MAETASPAPEQSLFERLLGTDVPRSSAEERSPTELDKIGDLVARSAYAEAGHAAGKLLREGVWDVRIVGPFLFGIFLERGPASAYTLFAFIHELLTKQWGAFGPRAKKEVLADNGLRWLFRAMNKSLESHERIQDATWRTWGEPRNREPLRQAIEFFDPLLTALGSVLPKGSSVPPLRQLVSWLQTFLRAFPPELSVSESLPETGPSPETVSGATESPSRTATEEPTEPTTLDDGAPEPAREQTPLPAQAPSTALQAARPMLPVSPPLELLMRKLQAFGALVRSQDFLKASVVASDVLSTVEHFDPRVYLPALFTPFFANLSTYAPRLEPLMQDTSSFSFRALHQLYQLDLDSFLAQGPSQEAESEE